jgi:ribulose-5-phosphate 4-epimerase/fuculose-1-phosphate aldolase
MKQIRRPNPETTRRAFISKSGLLLAGTMLASSTAADAKVAGGQFATAEPAPQQDLEALRADLATANHILYDQGVVDGYGHVSARHPANSNHFLISRWLAPDMVTEADILEVDFDCKPVGGEKARLYSEVFIHGEIYRARPDVKAIVHTHAPAVILMGISGETLMPMYQMTGYMGTGVPLFDIRKAVGMTNMLISDALRAKALVQTLADKPAVLMRGHGGVDMRVNAELQVQVLGKKMRYLAPEEAQLASNNDYPKDWEMWKRKVAAQRT